MAVFNYGSEMRGGEGTGRNERGRGSRKRGGGKEKGVKGKREGIESRREEGRGKNGGEGGEERKLSTSLAQATLSGTVH